MKKWWTYILIFITIGLITSLQTSAANPVRININHWLEVRRPQGEVIYSLGQTVQKATNGMRLQTVGETITTKQGSSVVLAIDLATGIVKVAENTTVTIKKLESGNKGQRITELEVKSGQINLQIRPLTNNTSRIEIKTLAGIAGVRGTEFGVSVQENGKMGIATRKGAVATTAQNQTRLVKAGFQNVTIPGQPPSIPVPIKEDTRLNINQLLADGNQVKIVGRVDPVNLLIFNQQPQNVDINGKFDIIVPLPTNRQVEVIVKTPLGKQQLYQLIVP
jgi:FecR protein